MYRVGDTIMVTGQPCVITKVHSATTITVRSRGFRGWVFYWYRRASAWIVNKLRRNHV